MPGTVTGQVKFKRTETSPAAGIPEGWELRGLGCLGRVVTGKTPPTEDSDSFGEEGYPFITPRDMHGQKYIRITERYLTEKGKDVVRNCFLPPDSVCVSCIGSDMGKVAMTDRPSITNQQLNSLICEHADPHFVYYGISNISNRLRDAAFHSTAVPILNKSSFSQFEIVIPQKISEQCAIAKILSDLDAKIELNHQMNKTLEHMARAIFKRWFVDFEFPGHEKTKFVDGLPEGWREGKFSDLVANIKEPLTAGEHLRERRYVPVECIPMKRIGMLDYKSYKEAQSSLIAFEKNDILFGAMRAYFHRVNFAPFPGITRTTTFVLRPKQKHFFSFSLFFLNLEDSVGFADQHSKGTTMPYAIWHNGLADMPIIIPREELLKEYSAIAEPILNRIVTLSEENRVLSLIRDTLLPKLLSGEIRVKGE